MNKSKIISDKCCLRASPFYSMYQPLIFSRLQEGSKKMLRKMIVSVAMLLLCGNAMAQPGLLWENFYGYPSANNTFKKVVETPDGGFLGVGTTDVSSEQQIFLVKTDSDGNEVWSRTYSFDPTGQAANDVVLTQDSCYACCGIVGTDALLFKVDANGDSIWARLYDNGNDEYFNALEQTEDGGFIIAGASDSGQFSSINYVVRTDANGDEIWSYTDLVGWCSWINWVYEADDGGFVIIGHARRIYLHADPFMRKVDASGNTLWTQIYGGGTILGACSADDDGYTLLQEYNDIGSFYYSLIKTDADGNWLWIHYIYHFGVPWLSAMSIDACDNGGFIIGVSFSDSGNGQGGLLKTDSLGNTIWSEVYGGPDSDGLNCVRQTADEGYIAAGNRGVVDTTGYAWLLRLASEGPVYVETESDGIPAEFALLGAYPNPFNASTSIKYNLPSSCNVTIEIYDLLGRKIQTLSLGEQQPGLHSIAWKADGYSSGVYFYRIEAGDFAETKKMLLLK